MMRRILLCTSFVLSVLAASAAEGRAAGLPVSYSRDIKPILSNHCYACHGPDEGRRKGKLRLDVRSDAVKKAIRPGKAADSPLIERVTTDDPEEMMPPPRAKRPRLSAAEVDLLKRWINQGAAFDQHWAYRKPARPAVPMARDSSWPLNPVDHFVAAMHEQHGLRPGREADRVTLLRRLSFDLTGLPPTRQEVEAFVNDRSPEAYEKVVERLLASPHYGERMAMYWLDLVRFADTNGYHSDVHRNLALYRDYVIQAFNTNKPFDRFTVEQLAGDLLPSPTLEQKIASGYNRLLMTTEEGGAQAKEYLAKYAADRVRNVSSVWMGSTMGCCECHNHKFDPFTTRDFYSLAAFFADIRETPVGKQEETPFPTLDQQHQLHEIEQQLAAARHEMEDRTAHLEEAQAAWEQRLLQEASQVKSAWVTVRPDKVQSAGGAQLVIQEDDSVLSTGPNPARDVYTVSIALKGKPVTALRLEALRHPSLTNGSLSRGNGNFVLTGIELELRQTEKSQPEPLKIAAAQADFEQSGYPVAHVIDSNPSSGWAVEGHVHAADHRALFVLAKPIAAPAGAVLTVRMKHESPFAQHNIGRFRLALTSAGRPSLDGAGLPEAIVGALKTERKQRSKEQKKALTELFRQQSPELATMRQRIARLEEKKAKLPKEFPTTLVSAAMAPRMMRILPRGNWLDDSGEVVGPATPAFLPPLGAAGKAPNRLDLAKWMVSRDNPLVARVLVNRLWKKMFGQGLVRSLDDFGTQGTPPTHPELLDWLAVELMDSGWDIKYMIRLLATSRAYRQVSEASKELREQDPTNEWLARQGRFRLDAEVIRDNALALSGLLTLKVGGSSVKPYQPAGYWEHLNFPPRTYQNDHGPDLYRRGLYTYWQRTFLHPSLKAFDAPTREECCVERPRSSTPLQALVLLNDPSYVEAARAFGERIMKEGGKDLDGRLDWAYQEALSRGIRPVERRVLAALYQKHLAEYQRDPDAARKLVSTGERPVARELEVSELAAWTSVARVILNLHETITRR